MPWMISVIGFALCASARPDAADLAVGVSSHILFLVITDYTVSSYGHYAASAVTGQSFAREIMAASLALVGETFCTSECYRRRADGADENVGAVGPPFFWPTMIIALISVRRAARRLN